MKSMEEKEQPATVHNLLQTRINNKYWRKTKQGDKHKEIPFEMEDGVSTRPSRILAPCTGRKLIQNLKGKAFFEIHS